MSNSPQFNDVRVPRTLVLDDSIKDFLDSNINTLLPQEFNLQDLAWVVEMMVPPTYTDVFTCKELSPLSDDCKRYGVSRERKQNFLIMAYNPSYSVFSPLMVNLPTELAIKLKSFFILSQLMQKDLTIEVSSSEIRIMS